MNSSEHNISQSKNQKTNENIINLGDSGSKKIEEGSQRTPSLKALQLKEKEKTRIKNAILLIVGFKYLSKILFCKEPSFSSNF